MEKMELNQIKRIIINYNDQKLTIKIINYFYEKLTYYKILFF